MNYYSKIKATAIDALPVNFIVENKPASRKRKTFIDFLKNIFGSDTVIPYTAEYTWLANQTGHALLGFFVGSFVWLLVRKISFGNLQSHHFLLYVLIGAYFIKEVIDFSLDAFCRKNGLKLNKTEIVIDGLTDTLFVSFGILVSFSFFAGDKVNLLLISILVLAGIPLLMFLMFGIWIPRMRMFDFSQLPLNYTRLTRYSKDEVLKIFEVVQIVNLQNKIAKIKKNGIEITDIIIEGKDAQTRSRVAVSLGCEFLSHWFGVYSISMVKLMENMEVLLEILERNDHKDKFQIKAIILDDINTLLPIPKSLLVKIHEYVPNVCFIWVLSKPAVEWENFIECLSKGKMERIDLHN